MPQLSNRTNCFFCRVMRGLAFGALGGMAGGYGALLLGQSHADAMAWALGGVVAVAFLMQYHQERRKKK